MGQGDFILVRTTGEENHSPVLGVLQAIVHGPRKDALGRRTRSVDRSPSRLQQETYL
jgi:hypothetical protein